jgi:class 3 adenylate cyclase/AmiR/NasT family two-component response regulator
MKSGKDDSLLFEKTILLVDDTTENIDILNELLMPFKRKVATNGEKALQLAASANPPDIILLDIDMPGMNGFEVCKRLKENPETQDIPVIFLTANTDKKTIVEGFRLGASDFMTKPFDPGELMVRVKTQLELTESRQRLETIVQQLELSSALLKQSGEEMNRQKNAIEQERKTANDLLLNVLPEYVAKELQEKGQVTPRHFPIATVLFADLVNFSRLSKGLSPSEMVDELNTLFVGFDEIIERNHMEKIKTIGDGYMAAGGLPVQNNTNPVDAVKSGLEMVAFMQHVKNSNERTGKPVWDIRIGIHTGDLIAGVIGKSKFVYDIWGISVNTASRMESAGEAGKVNISGITYQLVKDKFVCERRGNIEVKNMGKMDMYFVEGLK